MSDDRATFCPACAADPTVVSCDTTAGAHMIVHGVPFEEMPLHQQQEWCWLWRRLLRPRPGETSAALAPLPEATPPDAP